MKRLAIQLFMFLPFLAFAQVEVTINAYILDGATNEPIAFANIGFVEQAVGTVSDYDGKFSLTFDEQVVGLQSKLQISTLGYKTKSIALSKLYGLLDANNIIYLNAEAFTLDEVVISNQKREDVVLGNRNVNAQVMGYWKDKKGLGGEIATRLRVSEKQTRLKDLSFYVVESVSDSLLVRVNVYDYHKRYPGKNLLTQNIFYTIKKKEGTVTIPLEDYNIYVSDDVVVSIELIQVYGLDIGLSVASSVSRGVAYTRSLSQDKWVRFPDVGMGFFVNATQPSNSNKKATARAKPERLQLYWDGSYSMGFKNFQEEFDLLEAYLRKLDKPTVKATVFRAGIQESKLFECSGSCSELLDYLKQVSYYGGSSFNTVLKENPFNAAALLLFSDGKSVFNAPETSLNIPIFAVNSLKDANHIALQDLSLYADGHYIDLSRINQKEALDLMLNQIDDTAVYNTSSAQENQINGTITSNSGPIQGAQVWVKGTYNQVVTNADGQYSIAGNLDDVLQVSFLGMLSKDVLVEQTTNMDIQLEPDGELLEEVLIEAEVEEDDVNSTFGTTSRKSLGFAADFILAEDIPPYYLNLSQILAGRAGIQVIGFGDDAQFVFTRSIASSISNSSLPVIVIDGILYEQDQRPFIDIQNIDNIAIFRGTFGVNRYGPLAAYGVIRIETKTFALSGKPAKKKATALVSGNDYTDLLIPVLDAGVPVPTYVRALNKAQNFNEAKDIYKRQQQLKENKGIPYYIDVSEYFQQWDDDYAFGVLSTIAELAPDNVKALRVMAYTLEERGMEDKTLTIYQRIVELQPTSVQAYRDLALAYQYVEQYQAAFIVYKDLLAGNYPGVEISGMVSIIENELQHLIARHKNKVTFSDLPNSLLKADFNYDLRIVFEWTDPNLEFELQFVNPDNKYFTWSHTMFNSKERMLEEINQGYGAEEFVLDDNPSGKWIINIEHLGKQDLLNPTFLKYTVYKNYGLPSESKAVKLVKVFLQNGKVTLDSFVY